MTLSKSARSLSRMRSNELGDAGVVEHHVEAAEAARPRSRPRPARRRRRRRRPVGTRPRHRARRRPPSPRSSSTSATTTLRALGDEPLDRGAADAARRRRSRSRPCPRARHPCSIAPPIVLMLLDPPVGARDPPRAARTPRRSPHGRRRRASSRARRRRRRPRRPIRQPTSDALTPAVAVAQRSASCGSVRPPRAASSCRSSATATFAGIRSGPKRCSNSGAITPHLSVFERQSSAGKRWSAASVPLSSP